MQAAAAFRAEEHRLITEARQYTMGWPIEHLFPPGTRQADTVVRRIVNGMPRSRRCNVLHFESAGTASAIDAFRSFIHTLQQHTSGYWKKEGRDRHLTEQNAASTFHKRYRFKESYICNKKGCKARITGFQLVKEPLESPIIVHVNDQHHPFHNPYDPKELRKQPLPKAYQQLLKDLQAHRTPSDLNSELIPGPEDTEHLERQERLADQLEASGIRHFYRCPEGFLAITLHDERALRNIRANTQRKRKV